MVSPVRSTERPFRGRRGRRQEESQTFRPSAVDCLLGECGRPLARDRLSIGDRAGEMVLGKLGRIEAGWAEAWRFRTANENLTVVSMGPYTRGRPETMVSLDADNVFLGGEGQSHVGDSRAIGKRSV